MGMLRLGGEAARTPSGPRSNASRRRPTPLSPASGQAGEARCEWMRASGPNGGQIGNLFGHGGGLPGGGAGDRPAAPDESPEEAGLDRLKPPAGACRTKRWRRRSGRQGAELPLPGSKQPGFRANRGRRPRLWSVGRTGRSEYAATQGENG